jgi:Cu(I)/Ag(I) efflux system membrane fusion protein
MTSSNGVPPRADWPMRESAGWSQAPLGRWQKLRLVVKVIELRLRFTALMAITALVFAYWDTIANRYEKWMRPDGLSHVAAPGFEFYCPMHPHVVQNDAGNCPICGMTLAKRVWSEQPDLPAGVTARVVLAAPRVQQAGIETALVGYAPLNQVVTTVGYVAFDERRMANVVSKVPGKSRVEKLYVNVTGQNVVTGQPLAELYSPELAQAIEELLTASRSAQTSLQPQTDFARSLLGDRQAMVRASAEKLKRWGITPAQVDEIMAKGQSGSTFPILSPKSGHVYKKNVVEGQEVSEGFPMFEVIDLDTVWVQAQVYEQQLGQIHEGQAAVATVDAFPGERFSGELEFMQPHLDAATRTVEVRYALKNPGHRLRPGMFATVTLSAPVASTPDFRAQTKGPAVAAQGVPLRHAALTASEQKNCPVTEAKLGSMGEPIAVEIKAQTIWTCCAACPPKLKAEPEKYLVRLEPAPQGQVLSIPESAVIDTGTRKVVYVETGPGIYEGREVVLGRRSGDRFPVLEGLAPGETVAAAGAFLIDAESRLNPNVARTPSAGRSAAPETASAPIAPSSPATHRH